MERMHGLNNNLDPMAVNLLLPFIAIISSDVSNVDKARSVHFDRRVKPETLPPTSYTLYHHIQKCHYQTFLWFQASLLHRVIPPSASSGWEINDGTMMSVLSSLPPISESCLGLLSCMCTSTSYSTRQSKCRGEVYHSLGHADMQGIVLIPGVDACNFIVNVSWCICAFHRDSRNWFVLIPCWQLCQILQFGVSWNFAISPPFWIFVQQNCYFENSYMGYELIIPNNVWNNTNRARFTSTKSITNWIMDKKQMWIRILRHDV